MIQGGGFVPGMNQKETGSQIKNEADNGLKNDLGTIRHGAHPESGFGHGTSFSSTPRTTASSTTVHRPRRVGVIVCW